MEEPKITSGAVPYIASEIPDDPRDITPEQWEAMKAVDIRTVDKSQLVDLSTVHIDESLPVRERVLSYLKQVKNPYCVRVGNFAVKVKYKEDGPSFEEQLKRPKRNGLSIKVCMNPLFPKSFLIRFRTSSRLGKVNRALRLSTIPRVNEEVCSKEFFVAENVVAVCTCAVNLIAVITIIALSMRITMPPFVPRKRSNRRM